MVTPAFLVVDTETGGLDPRVHPLLSLAVVVADTNLEEVEGFSLTFLPPEGTVIEIPSIGTMGTETKHKNITTYMDVHTKKEVGGPLPDGLLIQAYAAEINGFITLDKEGVWDLTSIDTWLKTSMPIADGVRVLRQLIRQTFNGKPVICGHNTPFDIKFQEFHLPEVVADYAKLPNDKCLYLDTCKMLRSYKKTHGAGKGAKLSDLVACIGRGATETAHEALSDCRDCLAGLKWMLMQVGADNAKLASAHMFWDEFWLRVNRLGGVC